MVQLGLVRPHRGPVTQWYGNVQPDGLPHAGQDYGYSDAGGIYPEVFAAADGVVLFAGDSRNLGWPNEFYVNPDFNRNDDVDQSAGNLVVIGHRENGVITAVTGYGHLESISVRQGQPVGAGQEIAITGDSGYAFGKHLHFFLMFTPFNYATPTFGCSDPNPYFTGSLSFHGGTITPQQEDELSKQAEDDIARVRQILEAVETDRIRERIVAIDDRTAVAQEVTKYLKGDSDASLYEIVDGKLRGITLAEWQATGRAYRVLPQSIIDALPKAG